MTEEIIIALTPVIGLAMVVAFVWWQNERDTRPHNDRK